MFTEAQKQAFKDQIVELLHYFDLTEPTEYAFRISKNDRYQIKVFDPSVLITTKKENHLLCILRIEDTETAESPALQFAAKVRQKYITQDVAVIKALIAALQTLNKENQKNLLTSEHN